MKIYTLSFSILAIILLSGCGSDKPVQAHNAGPVVTLPVQVSTQLASFNKRLTVRSALPIIKVTTIGGQAIDLSSENVLYISPSEVSAIQQFQSIWMELKSKPAVVWTKDLNGDAQKVWGTEGFDGDPLPSLKTYYSRKLIPTPDAYHQLKSGWNEMPGVLPASQIQSWVTFFR